MKNKILKMAVLILMGPIAANAGLIEKAPDQGPWWSPLNSNDGSYIYANSFVADESGRIESLGFWAWKDDDQLSGQVILEVYEAGPTPDSSSVVARTAVIDLLFTDRNSLDFFQAPTIFSDAITAGGQYWFAANVIGLPTNGDFGVGGHTQNSGGIIDDGTFWASNDADGIHFDNENLLPEMAFRVNVIPEPGTFALLGIGVAGMGFARRRLGSL